MEHKQPATPDEALVRRIAGETLADLRTVRRVLRGERVRGVIGSIIRSAAERLASEQAARKGRES